MRGLQHKAKFRTNVRSVNRIGRKTQEFIKISGRVTTGQGNASYWLERFRPAYVAKTGMPIYPGSLNLRTDEEFSLRAPRLAPDLITMAGADYGGERDILMLPCVLVSLENTPALIWRTTTAEAIAEDRRVLEILAAVNLRRTFGLLDGDTVEVRIDVETVLP